MYVSVYTINVCELTSFVFHTRVNICVCKQSRLRLPFLPHDYYDVTRTIHVTKPYECTDYLVWWPKVFDVLIELPSTRPELISRFRVQEILRTYLLVTSGLRLKLYLVRHFLFLPCLQTDTRTFCSEREFLFLFNFFLV